MRAWANLMAIEVSILSSSVLLHQLMVPGSDSSELLVVSACFFGRTWIHALFPGDVVMISSW